MKQMTKLARISRTTSQPALITIGAQLPRDEAARLRAVAAAEDRSVAYVIRRAVRREIELQEQEQAA